MVSTKVNNGKLLLAVIASSGVLTMGALAMAIGQEQAGPATLTGSGMSGMTVGVTSTQTTPPTAPETPIATPALKGPAEKQ